MVKQLNRSSYICGDYNIDLLKIKTNKHFNDFFDNLISVGFFPKITLPTRFTEQSSTLIDNVFSNNIEEREISGILLNHISDHQFLFTYIEKLSYIEKVPKFHFSKKYWVYHRICHDSCYFVILYVHCHLAT